MIRRRSAPAAAAADAAPPRRRRLRGALLALAVVAGYTALSSFAAHERSRGGGFDEADEASNHRLRRPPGARPAAALAPEAARWRRPRPYRR